MSKIALAGCAILKNKSILLLHRKNPSQYELPGGKINSNEKPEDAAKRELKEELMCDVKIIRKFGTKKFEENGHVMTYTWFIGKIKKGQTPQIGEPEKFDHYKYVAIKKLASYPLSSNMKNFLREVNRGTISF